MQNVTRLQTFISVSTIDNKFMCLECLLWIYSLLNDYTVNKLLQYHAKGPNLTEEAAEEKHELLKKKSSTLEWLSFVCA